MSQLHFHSDKNFQNISDYSVIDIINYGSFGTCYKVKRKSLNKLYVWKAIDYGSMSARDKEKLQADVKMTDVNTVICPSIVRYYGTIFHRDSETLYAIMEYCQCGDLNALMNTHKLNQQLVNEKFVWKVLYQTSKAMGALHRTVSYLNIKPSNIFLDKHYNLKLADFGLTKFVLKSDTFSTFANVHYPSPEHVCGIINEKTDVWALGCLIHELCTLQSSFTINNVNELKIKTSKNKFAKLSACYSENLDKMIKLLINFDHNLRPSVETIIHHPTVICNYDRNTTPFHEVNLKSRCEKNYKETTSSAKDFPEGEDNGGVETIKISDQYIRPRSSVFFEPKKITEDVYNEKFFNRLKLLRVKETALKVKECDLKSKELYLNTIETNLVHKQKLIEKREREMNVLHDAREIKPNTCDKVTFKTFNKYKKQDEKNIDLESTTCSADPGDMSVMPTAAKLDPSKIIKPSCFQTNIQQTRASNNQCYTEQTCVDTQCINYLPSHQLKRIKNYGTLKKCKQLILKKK